ncbi:MAG: spermidine/putrescine ABC transporter ATP-binding protein [Planctomycetaceae bacterium]|nr:spermidine/putrescine ABC transporter ATP-binding protein [Planctomycetaceae bacterium]
MIQVSLRQLSKRFDQTAAVDQVDLVIEPGELFFLLGPSGCGKTTLLRMIGGLETPTAGSIHFGDRDVTQLPTGRRNTAMVFQSYALWPHMTVAQNIAFGLETRHVPAIERRQRAADAMRLTRIAELAHRHPMQLSGGQQQRVALARALVVRPDVLLLDEPLSNLDAKLRLEMRREIRRICKSAEITTIYVTHDQEEALSMADRIALMGDGHMCQIGPPHEIYNRPTSRFVADFLGSTNFIPAEVREKSNGRLLLQSPAGPIRSSVFPDDAPTGGNVTCSVRHEAVRLLAPDESADNIFTGAHLDTVYLGDIAQHTFELADGLRLESNEIKPVLRQWTEPARIGFDARDVIVLTN